MVVFEKLKGSFFLYLFIISTTLYDEEDNGKVADGCKVH